MRVPTVVAPGPLRPMLVRPMSTVVLRPLPAWTDPVTRPRKAHIFKATWSSTLLLLRREVDMLARRYVDPEIVLQVQTDESALRRDGGIRADAKVSDVGVVVSFESKHGPLRYACDTFTSTWSGQMPGWQANVRSIALGLEALRKVSRYGIGARGEAYQGWSELGSGIPMAGPMTRGEAQDVLARYALGLREFPADWAYRDSMVNLLYKRGAKLVHPDAGGDPAEFKRLTAARDLLLGAS